MRRGTRHDPGVLGQSTSRRRPSPPVRQAHRRCAASVVCWFGQGASKRFGQVGPLAIRTGCPAAAHDVRGIPECRDSTHSTLVPPGDVVALTAAARIWLDRVKGGLDTCRGALGRGTLCRTSTLAPSNLRSRPPELMLLLMTRNRSRTRLKAQVAARSGRRHVERLSRSNE